MSRTVEKVEFRTCYKTELATVIRGHHVYQNVWVAVIGEVLETAPDGREEAKDYDKYAVGVYKKDILVGHIPVEISSLCYHFLQQDPENQINAIITGKRKREVGLVVPANLVFLTNIKTYSQILENELQKRKDKFPSVELLFKKKEVYRKFPHFSK